MLLLTQCLWFNIYVWGIPTSIKKLPYWVFSIYLLIEIFPLNEWHAALGTKKTCTLYPSHNKTCMLYPSHNKTFWIIYYWGVFHNVSKLHHLALVLMSYKYIEPHGHGCFKLFQDRLEFLYLAENYNTCGSL